MSLCLINYTPRYEGLLGNEVAPLFLGFTLDGGKRSPMPFYPGERALCTDFIGGWVDHGAGLDTVVNRSIVPAGNQTPGVQPVACRYID
jgi:hypothetical protein